MSGVTKLASVSNQPEPTTPGDRIIMDVAERLNRDDYQSLQSGYSIVNGATIYIDKTLGVYVQDSANSGGGEWMTYNYSASPAVREYYLDAHNRATHRKRERNEAEFEAAYFARAAPKQVSTSRSEPGWLGRLVRWVTGESTRAQPEDSSNG